MTWILLQLAQYPEVQDKVRAEVNEILPDMSKYGPEQLEKLKYLNCVIKETMRQVLFNCILSVVRMNYSKTCLTRTPVGLNNLFGLDRCLVYTGSNYIDI